MVGAFRCTLGELQTEIIRDHRRDLDALFSRIRSFHFCRPPITVAVEGDQLSQLDAPTVEEFCNKACLLYFVTDRIQSNGIFGPVWREWYKALRNSNNNIDDQHVKWNFFFAKPISYQANVKLDQLPSYHKDFLELLHKRLEELKENILQGVCDLAASRLETYPHQFNLHPLCYAVTVVVDGERTADGQQNVVLVLTGDNSRLSKPVTSNDVPEEYRSRSGHGNTDPTFIRLPLQAAIKLIAGWYKAQDPIPQYDEIRDPDFGFNDAQHLHTTLDTIKNHGLVNCPDAMDTIQRMILRKRGIQPWPVELKSDVIPKFRISDWADFEPDPNLLQGDLETSFDIPDDARKQLDDSIKDWIQGRADLPPQRYKPIDPYQLYYR